MELGFTEDILRCTESAHRAMDRASKAASEMSTVDDQKLEVALPELAAIARRTFGADFEVRPIPFGLLFAEQARVTTAGLTGTGTVQCTFALKCGPDGDG